MRFTCPDSFSPFGKGGINPYVYCESDPINHTDPTGHFFLIAFFASLFSSLATAAIDAVGTAVAAIGVETGVAAGVATGAEAGAAVAATEVAAASSVASTSAAFGGVGTALSTGATAAAVVAGTAAEMSVIPASASATLGVVNAAIGTAIQVSSMTVGQMAIGLGVEYGGLAASFYTKLGRKVAENNAIAAAEMAVSDNYSLEQLLSAQAAYGPVESTTLYSTGINYANSGSLLNSNRTLTSVQKPDTGNSAGVQGTPARRTFLQSMGYHPSRLQANTDVQGLNQAASSDKSAEKESNNGMIMGASIFGMNNRTLHQQSYKSAYFKKTPQAEQ
ncbi:RHS repeat-associated core domain-containing protein [Buttiauxella gaviniae]|uniref:RHS repeat-associated core domain-containing protein n=1 Tax=Buttiauxella gaviniae TaxID=82990 RepID=A0ABV3NRJ9_9ENTR